MRSVPLPLLARAVLALLFVARAGSTVAEPVSLDVVLTKLAPPPSGDALLRIPDPGRKLLALRSYVRYGPKVADHWSWTREQVKAFEKSPEHQALQAEIAVVREHFRTANPGYEIYVHSAVRTLDEQIVSWNNNDSVRAGAEELLAAHKAAFGDHGLEPAKIDGKKLGSWLLDFVPSKRVNLAAPGLTRHGRASAIDFQVMKNGAIYAGASAAQVKSIWRAEGWDEKLKASIMAVSKSFNGPLADPDEPWHYDYSPPAITIASTHGSRLADILPPMPGARACFARRYDAKHLRAHPAQSVTGVTFLVRSTGFDEKGEWVLKPDGKYKYSRYLFAIRFARRNGKRAHSTSGECTQAANIGCHVECDGSGFTFEKSGEGLLLRLSEDGIRIDDCDERDVRLLSGADDTSFRVERVAEAHCRALEKATLGRQRTPR
jgi:hypothetical protein